MPKFITKESDQSLFKEVGLLERAGYFSEALSLLIRMSSADKTKALAKIYQININRIITKVRAQAKSFYSSLKPMPLFEHESNPRVFVRQNNEKDRNAHPIISVTTISSRIDLIEKTLNSIANQTIKPHSVNLYISSDPYMLDEGIDDKNQNLKDIYAMGVNIYKVPNIGPYRKQIPLIRQLNACGAPPNTSFITVDDDVIYPDHLVQQLTKELQESESVIAHRGRKICIENGSILGYRSFSPPSDESSLLNIGTGRNGIAYRLGYFPKNPNDFVGHIIAPTADDIWCKWITTFYCIPTKILEPLAAYNTSLDFAETNTSIKNGLFHKYNARGSNDEAIMNLEAYFCSKGVGLLSLLGGQQNV